MPVMPAIHQAPAASQQQGQTVQVIPQAPSIWQKSESQCADDARRADT